jgi:hypothetical protein
MEVSANISRAVCEHLGIPGSVVTVALESFMPAKGRLNHFEFPGIVVIGHTFDAHPLSMKFGLDVLAADVATRSAFKAPGESEGTSTRTTTCLTPAPADVLFAFRPSLHQCWRISISTMSLTCGLKLARESSTRCGAMSLSAPARAQAVREVWLFRISICC